MPKPRLPLTATGRRYGQRAYQTSRECEPSPETRKRLALNRFSYSGGYDGYEGRMMLKPEDGKLSGQTK
ncbi:hypothetical protein [Methylorubrum zatmanii]|nr:hypothetical protein [Methylorubrum zatmanii]